MPVAPLPGLRRGTRPAARLLLRAPRGDGTTAVLLQHRAPWSHQGGARDSHETVGQAAVREAREEAGVAAHRLTLRSSVVTATAGWWIYTTVIADAPEPLATVRNGESAELRWVDEDQVAELPLHPGFADSWDQLRAVMALLPLLSRAQ